MILISEQTYSDTLPLSTQCLAGCQFLLADDVRAVQAGLKHFLFLRILLYSIH